MGKGLLPRLRITAPTGSTVTASWQDKTITLKEIEEGIFEADVPTLAPWEVTATLDEISETAVVNVTDVARFEETFKLLRIYGATWDGTSTTKWTRTDKAANFADPVPYVAGASSYGSPFDNIAPWSEMTKVEDSGAGTLVKIPKFYYKLTQIGNQMSVQISATQEDDFSVSPAHMDRGDGKGERDVVYVGRYHCANNTYKSTSGESTKRNMSIAGFRTNIHNLGSTIWQADWAMRFTLFLLYIVEFADWDSQAKIGRGCGNGSGSGMMGYTDLMPYHTGTTQSSRDTYGLGTQYRYIEGLWDNVYDWIDGCYNDSNGLNLILNPSSFSDSSGGISVGTPSGGYPSKFTVKNVSGTFPLFIPSEASGSNSTYSCDNWNFTASAGGRCVCAGGTYSQTLSVGLFSFFCNSVNTSSTRTGSRLMKLP